VVTVVHKGFTIIELIVVLIFIGILAALVVPRYLELHNHVVVAELKSVVGAVESGSARNFAGYIMTGPLSGRAVKADDDCESVAILAALPGGLPNGYTAYGEKVVAYTGEHHGTCTIRHEITGKAQHAVIMLTGMAQ